VEPTVASLGEALRKQGHEVDRGAIVEFVETKLGSTQAFNRRKTILLMDDEKLARNVVLNRLKVLGYDTIEASDGRESVSIFKGC
jgi:hypothetical protein